MGETHHRAKVSDAVVTRIRDLHERQGMTLTDIAVLLGLHFGSVKSIATYQRRLPPHTFTREHVDGQ